MDSSIGAPKLKHFFNSEVIAEIARMIGAQHRAFDRNAFTRSALAGLDELELLPRARHIAAALRTHLPPDTRHALEILVASLPPIVPVEENHEFSSFLYLPYTVFIGDHGPEHFDLGMQANYEITQRFTAEFSIRPFLVQHQERTLEMLHAWTSDASHHVRRLVSEGTRPRLPWASRLPMFQRDPAPVIALLEKLKDDPSLYVRRSVANNLNDIGKDNPDVLFTVARTWLKGAGTDREWIVNHALRSSIKRGEKEAFEILGFGEQPNSRITECRIVPERVEIGTSVQVEVRVHNDAKKAQNLLVDLQVHFVKSNGSTSAKVFKVAAFELSAGESRVVRKTISVRQHTTRTHYPGIHQVDVLINNTPTTIGSFTLVGGE